MASRTLMAGALVSVVVGPVGVLAGLGVDDEELDAVRSVLAASAGAVVDQRRSR